MARSPKKTAKKSPPVTPRRSNRHRTVKKQSTNNTTADDKNATNTNEFEEEAELPVTPPTKRKNEKKHKKRIVKKAVPTSESDEGTDTEHESVPAGSHGKTTDNIESMVGSLETTPKNGQSNGQYHNRDGFYTDFEIPKKSRFAYVKDINMDHHQSRDNYWVFRIEKKSKLWFQKPKNQARLYIMVGDTTADIRLDFFGDHAIKWDKDLPPVGSVVFGTNFNIVPANPRDNYSCHSFMLQSRFYTILNRVPKDILEMDFAAVDNMPRSVRIRLDRDIMLQLEEEDDEYIEKAKLAATDSTSYVPFDVCGFIFKIRATMVKTNDNRDLPKIEAWLTNGVITILVAFIGDVCKTFRDLIRTKESFQALKDGFLEVNASIASDICYAFRGITMKFYGGMYLHYPTAGDSGEMWKVITVPHELQSVLPLRVSQTRNV